MPSTRGTAPAASRRAAPGRPRLRPGFSLLCTCLLGIFLVVFGASRVWLDGVALPHRYRALTEAGDPAVLKVERCATGMHGDRGFECEVTAVSARHTHTWIYPNDVRQFRPYTAGTQVAALSDPDDPALVYTVLDVQNATGAGWTAPGTVFGFVSTLGGLLIAACGWIVFGRGARAHRGAR